ncbi:hypothetical protein [Undibacterium sp. TS12]|uniref:hypothetical protein n=1 Tax=Undibacterium sp. TS12 TaxID=2908202 RepID=UPI001F4D03E5|nr:hypothetical protein [Undibacterium sp. TS12]MCH8622827.1 hypothetical protein [Undibacterium sp. TS12]
MPFNATASPSPRPPDTGLAKHHRINTIRVILSSALLTFLTASCAQSHDPAAQGNHSSGNATSSTSTANKKSMETTHQNASTATPHITAEDISTRMLGLIASIKTAGDLSANKLETATGLKVYVNPDNPGKFAAGAKITDTWFVNIKVIKGSTAGTSSRLMFSFDDQTNSNADMAAVCQVDFDAYAKRLTELGFQSTPYHGEHNRLIHWNFTRDKVALQISIRGESNDKVNHKCVSMIVADIQE